MEEKNEIKKSTRRYLELKERRVQMGYQGRSGNSPKKSGKRVRDKEKPVLVKVRRAGGQRATQKI